MTKEVTARYAPRGAESVGVSAYIRPRMLWGLIEKVNIRFIDHSGFLHLLTQIG